MNKHKQASIRTSALDSKTLFFGYDAWLITVVVFLLGFGLIMVASSSMAIAEKYYQDPLHFFWRQVFACCMGISVALIVLKIPMKVWQFFSVPLLFLGITLLVLILLPGIGKEVNGSMRWIQLGPFSLQASEPVKISIIAYIAGYLVRQQQQVCENFTGFIIPICILTVVSGLLLLEPDFGASVVLFMTTLGMLFLAGVPMSRFLAWGMVAISTLVTVALLSPYRIQRLFSFKDPWQDPFDKGYQLSQALIAFGRGDWLGVGLGSGIQKLFYLPEAHTDFVFAVVAEEMGLLCVVMLILLYTFIVFRSFIIAQTAQTSGKPFAAHFAYGIGLIIGIQVFINIGVNMGMLPTKGLTLPLMSYGSNSAVVNCVLLAILLRIEYENRDLNSKPAPKPVTHYVA